MIWIITGNMNAGGAESFIMELLRNKTPDTDIRLVIHSSNTDYSGTHDKEIAELNIPSYFLPSVGSVGVKRYTKAFQKLVSEIGTPDIVHINLNAVSGIIARAAERSGIPSRIIHCHANIKYTGSKISIIKNEAILAIMKVFVNQYGTHFWACSEVAAKRLFYKKKQYKIIPNMINPSRFICNKDKHDVQRLKLGIDQSIKAVVAIGRIAPIKNYELIIQAISEECCTDKNVHFYILGRKQDENYYRKLEGIALENHVSERVHFLGNNSEISEIIAAFDVFAMTSLSEGFGISALEAQAAGLPTIISMGVPNDTIVVPHLVKRIATYTQHEWAQAIADAKKPAITNEDILMQFQSKHFDSRTGCTRIYEYYEQYQGHNQKK